MAIKRISRPKVADRLDHIVAFGTAVLVVLGLGLSNGGYYLGDRHLAGVLIWWAVALGTAFSLWPLGRSPRLAWPYAGLLVVFAIWTGITAIWSDAAEKSVIEGTRVLIYAGVLILFALIRTRNNRGAAVAGVAFAGAAVLLFAVIGRCEPDIFPVARFGESLPGAAARLSYPFGYWNALGGFVALLLPLFLHIAADRREDGRQFVGGVTPAKLLRTCGAVMIPIAMLALYLTYSRGGAIAATIAVLVLLVASPIRKQMVWPIVLTGAASLALIELARTRSGFADGLTNTSALHQGDAMMLFIVLAVAVVGVVFWFTQSAESNLRKRIGQRPPFLSQTARRGAIGATIVIALTVAVAAGLPGQISDNVDSFKNPVVPGSTEHLEARLLSVNGSGRYQYWSSAAREFESRPVAGRGAGSFEYWWPRDGELPLFIRDAHSLYLETLGELGLVGFFLLLGVILMPLIVTISAWRKLPVAGRAALAPVAAGWAAFSLHAGTDWLWEIPAYVAVVLILAIELLAARDWNLPAENDTPPGTNNPAPAAAGDGQATVAMPIASEPNSERRFGARGWRIAARAVMTAAALVAAAAVMVPLLANNKLAESQAAARSGNYPAALKSARDVQRLESWATSGDLQVALIAEESKQLKLAHAAIAKVIAREPLYWRHWYVKAKIDLAAGKLEDARRSLARAKALNPRSPVFQ